MKYEKICKIFGFSSHTLYKIVKENNFIEKRQRYFRFLCNYAYSHGISIKKIAKKTGCLYVALCRTKKKNKIKTQMFAPPNKILTFEMEQNIIKDYQSGKSSVKLKKKYGFKRHKSILDVLIKHNIKRRPPKKLTNYNINYFEKINNNDNAYILGLLLTDGYVLRDYEGLAIQITIDDGYLLKRIAKRLGPSTHVKHIICDTKRKNMPNASDMCRLSCYSRKMANDLRKLEFVRKKSKILKCPDIPYKYYSSFCRGLWDGDGTVGYYRDFPLAKLVSASKKFLIKLAENLNKIGFQTSVSKSKSNVCYALHIKGGKKEITRFHKWLYRDCNDLFLKRKYDKVKNKIN